MDWQASRASSGREGKDVNKGVLDRKQEQKKVQTISVGVTFMMSHVTGVNFLSEPKDLSALNIGHQQNHQQSKNESLHLSFLSSLTERSKNSP